MIIFICFYILLRFVNLFKHLNKTYKYLNNLGLISSPPKPHGFVTLPLNCGTNLYKVNHTPFEPSEGPEGYKINPNNPLPDPSVVSNTILVPLLKIRSKPWQGSCSPNDLFTFDNTLLESLKRRSSIVEDYREDVIACRSSAKSAVSELFYMVIWNVKKHHKALYIVEIVDIVIFNVTFIPTNTHYTVNIAEDKSEHILAVLSVLVPVDFTLIERGPNTFNIEATNSLYAINWIPSKRIGKDLISVHGDAPGWQKGEEYYNKYYIYLSQIRSDIIHKRQNFFVLNTNKSYLPVHNPRVPLITDIGYTVGYRLQDLYLRRELQTFHLLPVSGFILFTVQTFMIKLDTLSHSELIALVSIVKGWDENTAKYHGRDTWLPVIVKYLEDNKA